MQSYASKNIIFLYIITFLDSLLEGLQEFTKLKITIPLEIGLKCIVSNYNYGYILCKLHIKAP